MRATTDSTNLVFENFVDKKEINSCGSIGKLMFLGKKYFSCIEPLDKTCTTPRSLVPFVIHQPDVIDDGDSEEKRKVQEVKGAW